jgi:hypothetical protein
MAHWDEEGKILTARDGSQYVALSYEEFCKWRDPNGFRLVWTTKECYVRGLETGLVGGRGVFNMDASQERFLTAKSPSTFYLIRLEDNLDPAWGKVSP